MSDPVVGIVGGGIVGLAIGREITRRRPGATVVVLEKQDRVATHQTGHNSGVVHAGIYYRPGSLKAELCTRGRHLLREYCAEHDLPYEECGKLVVAVDESELSRFEALERTARANGVPGLRRVDGRDIAQIEPHAKGLAALHSPHTAITDYGAICEAFVGDIEAAGGSVEVSTEVLDLRRRAGGVEILTDRGVRRVDEVVVCAGLQADRVSQRLDGDSGPRIIGFRGEYMRVADAKRDLVRGMVYPVPDPRYPFLGVHFTRRVTGELEVGPNAVLAPSREGYRRGDVSVRDLADTLRWPGFWPLARQHWRTGVHEVAGSLSVRRYMSAAQRYVPGIGASDVSRAGFGIRAQAVARDGTLVDDFCITGSDGVTCIRNAPSPAATSSLAIAQHVVDGM